MTKLFIIFTWVAFLFFSCKTPDSKTLEDLDREKFVGSWSGLVNTSSNCGTSSSTKTRFKIEKEGTINLKISELDCTDCLVFRGTAKGNSLNMETTTFVNGEKSATFKSGSLELVDYYLTGTIPLELSMIVGGSKYGCFGSAIFALRR